MWEFYVLFFVLAVWTLKNLPFINVDAAFRLQMWLRDVKRWLDKHDRD